MAKKRSKVKRKVRGGLKVSAYAVMSRAVDEGIQRGYNRAHKHGRPDEDAMRSAIEQAVMDAICEFFEFDDPEEGVQL
jgi:hypothetical protein